MLPLVGLPLICAIGIVGLEYDALGYVNLSTHALSVSPYIFSHQLIPRPMWQSVDMIVLAGTCGQVVLYAILLRNLMKPKFRMFLSGRVIRVDSKGKIDAVR